MGFITGLLIGGIIGAIVGIIAICICCMSIEEKEYKSEENE